MKQTFAIFLRQLYLLRDHPSRLIMTFYWASIDLIIWGVLTAYLNRVGGDGVTFFTVIMGAVIFSHFLVRVQHGVGLALLEDVWTKNFVNIFSSPITIRQYMSGLAATSTFTTFAALIFMAFLSWILFAYNIFQFGFALLPFIAVLFIFGLAFGLLGVVLLIRFGPSAETLIWTIPASLAPLSGVFYPIAALPQAVQWISNILPSTYVFEGMRTVVLSGTFSWEHLLIALGLSLVYLVLAYLLLLRYYRLALEKGLFIRFLSEAF